jgi:Signal transduction histidine kinase regulating C4-dicarboxylate transport system
MRKFREFAKLHKKQIKPLFLTMVSILLFSQTLLFSQDFSTFLHDIKCQYVVVQNDNANGIEEPEIHSYDSIETYPSGPYKSVVGFTSDGGIDLLHIDGLYSLGQTGTEAKKESASLLGREGDPVLSIDLVNTRKGQSVLMLQFQGEAITSGHSLMENSGKDIVYTNIIKSVSTYNNRVMWRMILLMLSAAGLLFWAVVMEIKLKNAKEDFLLSEQIKLAEKDRMILHQSRLASIGELTGDIVHQWKQPLNHLILIVSNIENCYEDEENLEFMRSLTKEAKKTIKLLSSTADDFRNFIKPDTETSCFDVAEVVRYAVQINHDRLIQNNIRINTDISGNTRIYGYRSQLLQVILNLIGNSVDAIAEKETDDGEIFLSLAEQKTEILFSVRDNGGGVSQDSIPHLFQAYFSTKGVSGTGIGLYMSKKIIEESFKGALTFQNVPGGALFSVSIQKFGEK